MYRVLVLALWIPVLLFAGRYSIRESIVDLMLMVSLVFWIVNQIRAMPITRKR